MALRSSLHRLNQRHPWSHNDHYGPWIAGRVTGSGARHVLDVGCGAGNLVALLRRRAVTVTGLEPDPRMARAAAERFADDPAVTIVETGFAGRDLQRRFDAITLVAVLHHLPLVPALRELRGCLAPGGRLVVVGCYRETGRADLLVSLLSVVLNPLMGLAKHPARAAAPPLHMTAPTADPQETLSDIRAAAAQELPGVRIRRRLFWRYSLVYDAPVQHGPAASLPAGAAPQDQSPAFQASIPVNGTQAVPAAGDSAPSRPRARRLPPRRPSSPTARRSACATGRSTVRRLRRKLTEARMRSQ